MKDRRKMNGGMVRRMACLMVSVLMVLAAAAEGNARPKVGLVLGGGGAKGAAEVGVLKYIEKAGIPIDYIAGTSIGSIVGGLYACGYRSEQLDSMFRSQDWLTLLSDRDDDLSGKLLKKRDGVTYVFGFPVGRKGSKLADESVGVVRGDNIIELLERMTGTPDSLSFDSLPIPFRCVATDYMSGREVVMSSGNLARSMRASMAIPGVFKSVDIDGVELMDGGLLNNLPVDVVLDMGADIVIAIDLTQNKHEDEDPEERMESKKFSNIGGEVGMLLQWVARRPDLLKYKENRKHVEVYINPELEGYGAASFGAKKISRMISIGEAAGAAAYDELLQLKQRLEE